MSESEKTSKSQEIQEMLSDRVPQNTVTVKEENSCSELEFNSTIEEQEKREKLIGT